MSRKKSSEKSSRLARAYESESQVPYLVITECDLFYLQVQCTGTQHKDVISSGLTLDSILKIE